VSLGAITVSGERIQTPRYLEGSRYYYNQPTLFVIPLSSPLASGETVEIGIEWTHTIPHAPTYRGANLDNEVFAVAQWYPRLAVYDDVYGWDVSPYLGDGEFYLEYGSVDVAITLPAGWLVGATGTLTNAATVLSPAVLERLGRVDGSDSVVHVVEASDRGPGRATAGQPGDQLTWRFEAEDVRDFVWSASADYVWDAAPGAHGATVHTLYRPQFTNWREAWKYARHALSTMSRDVSPYRYAQITAAEGPIPGMEYPMIVFIRGAADPRALARVIIHEIAHQWFPMAVGSMEAKYAWMDEGLAVYWTNLSSREFWGDEPVRWGADSAYLQVAGTEREVPIMHHTDLVSPYGERVVAALTKPAVMHGLLRSVVGDSVYSAALRDYYASWYMKHPLPWDFFNTFERHAAIDLDWFWRPLLFETDVLDHAVHDVRPGDSTTTIVVQDLGDVVLPTPLLVTMQDGASFSATIGWERWLTEGRLITLRVAGVAQKVELDPEALYPDVHRENNVWQHH
jgi:hypothetical protein